MTVRRCRIPLALVASAAAAVLSCGDPSPVGVSLPMPVTRRERFVTSSTPTTSTTTTSSGLLQCSQSYDSVTQVIGPEGGYFAVGPHILWVDTMALSSAVSITAVAPAGTVRWVRFQPDGLVFRTNGAGLSAILATSYKDCGVAPGATLRIAQITDLQSILAYLDKSVQAAWQTWSQTNQYVAAVLPHFSNYAVAW